MLYLAVCDDEKPFRDTIGRFLKEYFGEAHLPTEIYFFSSGVQLAEMEKKQKYDVIFLDVEMPEMDGMEAARRLRLHGCRAQFVFLTSFLQYSLEGYKVGAFRYILKGGKEMEMALRECLDALIPRLDTDAQAIWFDFVEGRARVFPDDILYVESRLHKLSFHIQDSGGEEKIYGLYGKMDHLKMQLERYGFLRIHQSFYLNPIHIREMHGYEAQMDNGVFLPVAKARYKEAKASYLTYKGAI